MQVFNFASSNKKKKLHMIYNYDYAKLEIRCPRIRIKVYILQVKKAEVRWVKLLKLVK